MARTGERGTPAVLAAMVVAVASCAAPAPLWRKSWSAPYADFDTALQTRFERARSRVDDGQTVRALAILRRLGADHPDNIEIGVWTQELELGLMQAGDVELTLAVTPLPDEPPEELLRRHYAQLVYEAPSVAGYVLAARLEDDAIAAELNIDRALELDPRCAWAYYGRAHAFLRQRYRVDRWREAHSALRRALELHPAHLRARRLQAWMFAQEGTVDEAAAALEAWLEQTADDARVTRAERIEAELDLALVWILRGRPRPAKALLATLEGTTVGRARRLATLAVAEQELGDLEAALDAARRAEDAQPGTLLPLVQQALIAKHGFGDDAAAQAHWSSVVEAAKGQSDLAAMLQSLRARVEIERGAAQAAARDVR